MADHLASIYGTEKDKVNCSFYYKIGACRHGDSCTRKHIKPAYSCTVLLPNIYQGPEELGAASYLEENHSTTENSLTKEQLQKHFDLFYEQFFIELSLEYGKIEEMVICDNIGEHLMGNLYVRFLDEETASKANESLNNRWWNGKPIFAELSPVTDFREACCKQWEGGDCDRGGFCNFMHLKYPTRSLKQELFSCQSLSLK